MSDPWSIVESTFDPRLNRAYEGLFTLGSESLHVRGSLEEHLSDAPQNVEYLRLPTSVTSERFPDTKARWGTYVPGLFGRHPLLNHEMVNLPWFLGLTPWVNGQRLDTQRCRIHEYRRELRLDTATLTRDLRWEAPGGTEARVRFERFISAVRPRLCGQRITIEPAAEADLLLRGGIDANVRTNGYDHFSRIELGRAGPSALNCRVVTDAGDDVSIRSELRGPGLEWQYEQAGRRAELLVKTRLPAGATFVVEKRSAVVTSRDRQAQSAEVILRDAASLGFEQLQAEHAAEWRRRWEACDVQIEGDERSQLALRLSLYHLLRCHPAGPHVAIDGKGYSGEAYWGRFFWDTEMFLLPFFLYTQPQRARSLVDFRVRTLPGARENAQRYGYPGARYAWESDADGREGCPNWQYADHQVHVTSDVVYGLAHYAAAADDPGYLSGPAGEVIIETARYWLARVDWRDGWPVLLGVMGPDEYTPVSNNNAYTNRMVAFALRLAAQVGPACGATPAECREFLRVAEGLPLPRASDGLLVLQCEEFERLADPRFEELWLDRSRPFASQVSQERLYRTKCIKQADVLMLMMLFPDEFSDEEVRRAWEYYLPLTTHDSSLSPAVHAIVASRLGLDGAAWEFWQRAIAIDLDVSRGGAAEGIHIANAGGIWQIALLGFAGLRTALQSDVLSLRPRLPTAWRKLAFPFVWKGCPVRVEITPQRTLITNRGSAVLRARVDHQERVLEPGERPC
jgi:trehalose/maltose hydrolase-like predicted phosphorylase